jgi:cell division protein FtsI (penicillin-binding protein 3)
VVSARGDVLLENQPTVVRRVISEKTARSLAAMLKEVTHEGGTGKMANIEGFEVAGKTGTAQKADLVNGGYSRKRVASFIGFVPADDPRIVVSVLIDEPEGSVYGGVVAAPAFRNIARGALRQLDVAPQRPDFLHASVIQPEPPLRRVPRKDADVGDSRTAVPDFVGLSLREAVERARDLKLKVKMHGHGFVVKQLPPPGGRLNENDVLVLSLQG